MISEFRLFQILQLALFLFLVNSSWGQMQNPFELHHRLDKVEITEIKTDTPQLSQDTQQLTSDLEPVQLPPKRPDSPEAEVPKVDSSQQAFDEPAIYEPDSIITSEKEPESIIESDEGKDVLELPEMLQSRRNLIFSTFIILTLFLTVVISFNRAIVNKVMRSILNDNYLNLLYREQKGRWSMQFLFLYIFFIANLALLLFLMDDKWEMDKINANLLYLCGIIALVYFSRHFSLNLLGHTFPIGKETGQFSFTIMLFNIFLGLVLLPINLFIAFAPEAIADTFIYIGIGVVFLFYILRQLRGLFIGARFIMNSKFHFLLYLCTVEIAPMAVLYKFFQPFFI